jgi:hypothetical protein
MQHAPEPPEPSGGLTAVAEVMAAGATGRWLRAVSQLGLVSRGVVYLLVAYLTMRLALLVHARNAEPASTTGAVAEVARHSWGLAALVLLAAGFAGYALTQLVETVFRPHPSTFHQWRQRLVSAWGCLLYVAFCASTISLLASGRRPVDTVASEQQQDTAVAATLLRTEPGSLLLLLVGVLLMAAGAELGRRSVRLTFQERFTTRLHPPQLGVAIRVLGAFGCVARAAVFVLVGVFIFRAGVLGKPQQTKGLDATFRSVARSPYGPITLAVLASGLACYGLYCLLEARYRDLTPGR